MSAMAAMPEVQQSRRFQPFIPPRPPNRRSPSTSMHESPARTGGGGGSVILRVKRRREEEPLDALLVAERAKKRGAGQSLQAGLDSLSLAGGETGERAAAEVGGVAAASGANGSSLGTNSPDPARKIFKLLGSSGGGGGGGSSAADVSVCDSPVSKGEGGGIVPFEQPGGAGLESGREAEKVRELIRKMTSDQTCRSLASSAQRQKELACIVDLEFEHGGDGGVKFRSASSVSPSRPSAGGGAGGGSPANPATPAGKGAPESARRDMGAVLCNGSPLIRESLSSTLGDGYGRNGYGLPTDTRNGHSEDMRDEGVGADSAGAGQKDDEFVYDYYWADPADRADTAAGAGGGWAASAKVAKLELDLDDLWDDDRVLLEEDQWDSDEIPESDDSNAEGYARNEYPDEDEGEDALDEDDFDHSLSGGMYAQAAWRGGDSDGEDESSDEEQRWRPKGLRRFAFDQDRSESEGNSADSDGMAD